MYDFKSRNNLRLNLMLIVTAAGPLFYSTSILSHAVNVPVGDDYGLLGFVNEFHALSAYSDKIRLLFSPHNEHRLVIPRVVSLLVELIFGSLDFRILLLVGNAALLTALFQLGRTLNFGNDLFKWTLLFLIALQPQYEKLMFYPLAALQAYFGVLFAIVYLRCLLEKRHLMFSMLFYVLAIFTTGSGIFLLAVGAPVLIYQRQQAALIVHLLLSLVVGYFYFFGLTAESIFGFTEDSVPRLSYAIAHPVQSASFFLQLLGGIAAPPYYGAITSYMPLAFGFMLTVYFVFDLSMTARERSIEIKETHIKQLVFLWYCMLQLLLIVAGRVKLYYAVFSGNLLGAALDGRYRIYGILITAVALIGALDRFQLTGFLGAKAKTTIIISALAFNAGWYFVRFESMKTTGEERVTAMRAYVAKHDPSVLPTWAIKREYAVFNLDLAISTGVYKPAMLNARSQ